MKFSRDMLLQKVRNNREMETHVSCLGLWERSCYVTPLLDILPTHDLPLKAE